MKRIAKGPWTSFLAAHHENMRSGCGWLLAGCVLFALLAVVVDSIMHGIVVVGLLLLAFVRSFFARSRFQALCVRCFLLLLLLYSCLLGAVVIFVGCWVGCQEFVSSLCFLSIEIIKKHVISQNSFPPQ